MLKDDADAAGCLAQDAEDALAQEGDPARAICLAAVQEDDRPALLVVRRVEPVALREGRVRLRWGDGLRVGRVSARHHAGAVA